MRRHLLPLALLAACGTPDEAATSYTYEQDTRAILDRRCVSCHQTGDIAPFALDTWEDVERFAGPIRSAVAAGTMPPWQAGRDCNTYKDDFDLTDEELDVLLDWLDGGAPRGTPVEEVSEEKEAAADPFRVDVVVQLPEAYTPVQEPDDYRCQLVEWPVDHPAYIAGVRVNPDQKAIVHHTILFAASAAQREVYEAMDAADPGPGYACYGGPRGSASPDQGSFGGMSPADLAEVLQGGLPEGVNPADSIRWLGSWVPGATARPFPEGTGIRMEPGDLLIVQMHYNTLSATPVADRSSVEVMVEDEVERPAVVMPFTDLGWITGLEMLGGPMTIPAGEAEVTHETGSTAEGLLIGGIRRNLGLDADDPLVIHSLGQHMHQLGTSGHIAVERPEGDETCLLDIPDWDFAWQSNFALEEPVLLRPEDRLTMRCTWDNSAENQPIVDGEVVAPHDVAWGEGTLDEMCLGVLYVTGP